ncbi:MAG: class I SAM-dependent methyltransferase [Polyangiales bacterium]
MDSPIQELTERQQREREFYSQYSQEHRHEEVNFDPVQGDESRPWNSYWRLYEVVQGAYRDPSQRLLDFGCGLGTASMCHARIGYRVSGFDLCEENIVECRRKAEQYGVADRTDFSLQAAEALGYPDDSFDVVAGFDILHHVEVDAALTETRRVLKPGGIAVFREFVEVPMFDALRNSTLGTWLVPNQPSLADHRTEDEEKLTREQLKIIEAVFPDFEMIRFNLLSRLNKFLPNPHPDRPSRIEMLDQTIFRWLPATRTLGGDVVMVLRK